MNKLVKQIFILIILVALLVLPYLVFAKSPAQEKLEGVGEGAGYAKQEDPEATFDAVIGGIIEAFLGLLGIIFIVLMLYGGYNWMTSAGDEQKVTKAKETIRHAIIGVIIVAAAYGIWAFIAERVL